MARKFGPFDSPPTQFYEVENRRMQRAFNPNTGFVKTGQGQVTAGTGAELVIAAYPDGALIDGLYVENPSSEAVTLTTNTGSTNPRIDRLVMRLDMTAKTIEPFQIVGTPAASPSAPPLVKTDTVVDMPLCRYTMPGSASAQNPGSIVDERVSMPRASRLYRLTQWSVPVANPFAATNNYNLGSLTINPGSGPYALQIHASGVFSVASGATGSLRINITPDGIVGTDLLSNGKQSAQPVRYYEVTDGRSVTVTANLEVLTGAITAYADSRNSYLEALAVPL